MTRVFQKYSFTITTILIISYQVYYIIICISWPLSNLCKSATIASLRDDEFLNTHPLTTFPFHNKELYAHRIRLNIIRYWFILIYMRHTAFILLKQRLNLHTLYPWLGRVVILRFITLILHKTINNRIAIRLTEK
jgi:hypothetical protein